MEKCRQADNKNGSGQADNKTDAVKLIYEALSRFMDRGLSWGAIFVRMPPLLSPEMPVGSRAMKPASKARRTQDPRTQSAKRDEARYPGRKEPAAFLHISNMDSSQVKVFRFTSDSTKKDCRHRRIQHTNI